MPFARGGCLKNIYSAVFCRAPLQHVEAADVATGESATAQLSATSMPCISFTNDAGTGKTEVQALSAVCDKLLKAYVCQTVLLKESHEG
jgi:hypothetical protein